MSYWGKYVSVAEKRAKAKRKMDQLRKKGEVIRPVEIEGRTIARSFWGKSWCNHLESFSDYANRLPRGRTYVQNGLVCHLDIAPGQIEAYVYGTSLYRVSIGIDPLKPTNWNAIKKKCTGKIGSMLELFQGRFSDQVMAVVSDRKDGLFPKPGEIHLRCSCPDWAVMCKHVAAVLYGVGSRLDEHPELLFLLRGVDAEELIAAEFSLPVAKVENSEDTLDDEQLSEIFGIEFDDDEEAPPIEKKASGRKRKSASKKTSEKKKAENKTKKPTASKPAIRIRPTGKSVARLRKKLGLSVSRFAEEAGVTPATINRWEATKGRLTLHQRSLSTLNELHLRAKKG